MALKTKIQGILILLLIVISIACQPEVVKLPSKPIKDSTFSVAFLPSGKDSLIQRAYIGDTILLVAKLDWVDFPPQNRELTIETTEEVKVINGRNKSFTALDQEGQKSVFDTIRLILPKSNGIVSAKILYTSTTKKLVSLNVKLNVFGKLTRKEIVLTDPKVLGLEAENFFSLNQATVLKFQSSKVVHELIDFGFYNDPANKFTLASPDNYNNNNSFDLSWIVKNKTEFKYANPNSSAPEELRELERSFSNSRALLLTNTQNGGPQQRQGSRLINLSNQSASFFKTQSGKYGYLKVIGLENNPQFGAKLRMEIYYAPEN